MAYVSLYRKYRSASFLEVIGQEHVTATLQNALRGGRIAHAYLFCGPRGCGKTSTARLLARALNCLSADLPTAEPCGTCDLCLRIRDGACLDVIEMDAASETGIDDVREKIIENAKFAPAEARFKVYIIDEVHDLSQKAFDSLLKTVEEPPAHVIFILATTEAHKVPITVRSRCQRMDFRRGTMDDLIANLRRVVDAEGIEADSDALAAVARAAEGSFRDSLSILEQVLAYSDGRLTADAVHDAVGTIGPELLDEVIAAIAADDLEDAFSLAGRLVDSGKDVRQILIAVQSRLRDLLVAGVARSPAALPDSSPERFAALKEQSALFRPPQVIRMLEILAESERDMRFTNQHRLLLEVAFWSILPGSLAAIQESHPTPAPPIRSEPRPSDLALVPERDAPAPARQPASVGSSVEPAAPFAPGSIDIDGIRRLWPKVLRRITQSSRSATAVFDSVHLAKLDGRFLVLEFPTVFARDRADRPRGREAVEKALAEEIGMAGIKIRCESREERTHQESAAAPVLELPENNDSPDSARNSTAGTPDSAEEDLLTAVRREFRGKLVEETEA